MTPNPADSRERGSFLLVILALGAVILMVASTTLLSLRNSSKISGMQRRDYQDLHAAEAGLIRMQSRLNQAGGLCNGWFSAADSGSIVAALVPTVDSLPSSYGSTRAARAHTFTVLPGRPMRIRFSATGGRFSGGLFDSSSSHTVKGTLRMATLADFAAFSELPLRIGTGSRWRGKVHGDSVHIGQGVTFDQEVTYVRGLDYQDPAGTFNDPNTVTFTKGKRQLSANPFTLDRIFISSSEGGRPNCGGSSAKTYENLARGEVSGEKSGFYYDNSSYRRVYIPLDSVKLTSSGTSVQWKVYNYDGTRRPPYNPASGSSLLQTQSVATSNFNGVVYVKGDAFVGGALRGFSLTIAASSDIYATHSITCVGNDTLNQDLRVTLGLIAASDVRIWRRSPTSITVDAAVVARDGWYMADTCPSYTGILPSPPYPSGSKLCAGDTSHQGVYPSGASCGTALIGGFITYPDTCWNLRLLGGYITHSGGGSGPWYHHGLLSHKSRTYEYDADNLYSPPPKFPALWGQNGSVPMWQAISVGEN